MGTSKSYGSSKEEGLSVSFAVKKKIYDRNENYSFYLSTAKLFISISAGRL